jgi:hypothetical protein
MDDRATPKITAQVTSGRSGSGLDLACSATRSLDGGSIGSPATTVPACRPGAAARRGVMGDRADRSVLVLVPRPDGGVVATLGAPLLRAELADVLGKSRVGRLHAVGEVVGFAHGSHSAGGCGRRASGASRRRTPLMGHPWQAQLVLFSAIWGLSFLF